VEESLGGVLDFNENYMNKYIFEHINWWHLKKEWYSKDEVFEYLCADFMKIRFNLKVAPSLWW